MRLFNKLTEKPLAQFPFRIAIYWSSLVSTVAKMPLLEKQVCPCPSHMLCQTCTLDEKVFSELKRLRTPTPFLMDMLPLSSVLLELIVKLCSKRAFGF